nr:hypothetical protein [Streptomyces sp. SID8379]
MRGDLSVSERTAVMSVAFSLEDDPTPDHARSLPDADPASETYVIELLPERTGGRGISVVYRHSQDLDAVLILWIIAGP